MRPSPVIQQMLEGENRALRRENAALRARLVAVEIEPEECFDWANGLEPRHIAVMVVLIEKYPRAVASWALADAMPKRDHASDGPGASVKGAVCDIRRVFGRDCIETVPARRYRCGAAFYRIAKPV